jgi:NAD-dependent dihydropyrimidine dehydrogenase PreA subunit
MSAFINSSSCTGCGVCVNLCPQGVFAFDQDGLKVAVVAASRCTKCFMCEDNCRYGAITVRIPSIKYPYWPVGMNIRTFKE